MKRRVLLAALLSLSAAPVYAEGPTATLARDDVLRGRFVQERHLAGFSAPLRSEGDFVLSPGRGLVWRGLKPFAVVTVMTPAGLAQSVNGAQTLKIEASKLPFLARLYDMLGGALAGDWSSMEADFTIVRAGDPSQWKVELTPRRTDNIAMPFRAIAVAGGQFVNEVVLTKPDGDFDRLLFLDQSVSRGPPTPAEVETFSAVEK